MNWNNLISAAQLEDIIHSSFEQPQVLFKHSTRCSISNAALGRLERNWKNEEFSGITTYYLDLLKYRDVSNAIAERFQIAHESPQVLVIKNGICIYHVSHTEIDYHDLKDAAHLIN